MKGAAKWLVPEVVQSSAIDCGPAALKSFLGGFGVQVSYGRLRESCQTHVDGTSIDVLEEVAVQLGLDAEQVMVPLDLLLMPEIQALPAIVVVRQPSGHRHFVVVWRRVGPFLQVMDPGRGRLWTTVSAFLRLTYVHEQPIPAAAFREWARSEEFIASLRKRLHTLKVDGTRWIEEATAEPSWRGMAQLDAAIRMAEMLRKVGGVRSGDESARLIEAGLARARDATDPYAAIPYPCWTVHPHPPEEGEEAEEELVLFRGAVVLRASGLAEVKAKEEEPEPEEEERHAPLPPELAEALKQKDPSPTAELWRMLKADGVLTPAVICTALILSALGTLAEALIFRGLIDLTRDLSSQVQRTVGVGVLGVFLLAMLGLEVPLRDALLRAGRHLELRLRTAFFLKVPRIHDRYFQSRLVSDMAERSHAIYSVRRLPLLAAEFLRTSLALLLTTLGIAWLDPALAPLAATVTLVSVGVPLLVQPYLAEHDLRVKNHNGAISKFYLDSLMGAAPLRAHGAEKSVRREHETLVVEWVRASLQLQRTVVGIEAVVLVLGYGFAAWLVGAHLSGRDFVPDLLFIFWALSLPMLGQRLAQMARQYPSEKNRVVRLLEPLGAPEEGRGEEPADAAGKSVDASAVDVRFEAVKVVAAGQLILDAVDLHVAPGSHVAIVGASGAGKSTLLGLLLGWYEPAEGRVLVDGQPLRGEWLQRLRERSVWVDPTVRLFNLSLFDNLLYGAEEDGGAGLGEVLDGARLQRVVERLPDGLQTRIGEGGGMLSGGEGQRTRFGRGLVRRDVQLALLDEPFRALQRSQRRTLLKRARKRWKGATLLCVTHDIDQAMDFDRVLVVEDGRIVEDGVPAELLKNEDSRFRALAEAERSVREATWGSDEWRRLLMVRGRLAPAEPEASRDESEQDSG